MRIITFALLFFSILVINNAVASSACTQRLESNQVSEQVKKARIRLNTSDQAFIALSEHMAFKPGYEKNMGTSERKKFLHKATKILDSPGVNTEGMPVSLLVDAARWHHYDIVELLLSRGMNLHCYAQTTTDNFLKAFSWPFHERDKRQEQLDYRYKILGKILTSGANPNETNLNPANNGLADYPLNYAAKKCDLKAVRVLLKHKANANLKAAFESYPILSACGFALQFYNDVSNNTDTPPLSQIIKTLLKHGANPNTLNSESTLDQQKVLQGICSGRLKGSTALDYYQLKTESSQKNGNTKRAALYKKAAKLIAAIGGKPLKALCANR